MTLPELPIPMPPAEFPLHIPELVHPLVVHFAIALPFLILLLELVNIATRKRTIGVTSFAFMVLLTMILYSALLTGSTDAQAAKAAMSAEAKTMLAEHKQWAVYLFYASVVLMLIKLLSVLVRKTPLRVFFFIVLMLFAAATLATGKRGGALVYTYGVNVGAKKTAVAAPSAEAKAEARKEEASVPETAQEEPASEEKSAAPASEEKKSETQKASEEGESNATPPSEGASAAEASSKVEEKTPEAPAASPSAEEKPKEEQENAPASETPAP